MSKGLAAGRTGKMPLVNAMLADGTVLRIFQKYFSAELAAAMVEFQSKP
jgi:polar amino acid transport system substrate-binding protein